MAEIYDFLGRIIVGQNTGNLTLNEIKALISTAAKSPTGPKSSFRKEPEIQETDKLNELNKIFDENLKNFTEEISEQKTYLQEMVELLKVLSEEKINTKPEREANKKEKKSKKDRGTKQTEDKLKKLADEGLKKNSIGVHDAHCEVVLNNIFIS